ncbi:MAG: type II secretion system F family protein [Bacteriovoracia bacterium]
MLKYIAYLTFGVAAFGLTYSYNKRFLEWLRFQSLGTRDYIVEKLSIMFVELPSNYILVGQFVISFGSGALVFLLLLPKVIPGFLFGATVTALGWRAPKPIVDYLYGRRVKKFVLQMIDALALMANGMKSGLSISQAMGLVVNEMPNPIKQEFSLILSQNKLGVPLEEAFLNLSKRVESDDVEMFVTSVNILKETGGNLAETFDTIVNTLRERIKVENKIDALTAQAKTQGMILLAVPPVMGLVLYYTDPEFISPLVQTNLGWIILFGILLNLIVGSFVIRKIVNIDV